MYKIQEKDRPESAHWLNNSETSIGNTPSADIPLRANIRDDVTVTILARVNDILLQNSSHANVTVNGQTIDKTEKLQHGDEFEIEGVSFNLFNAQQSSNENEPQSQEQAFSAENIQHDNRLWQLLAIDSELSGSYFKLGALTVIGRDQECNICIPNEQLSRRHLQLVVTGGKVMMQDLNSTNGCYVNEEKAESSILEGGDLLRIGNMSFKLVPPAEKPSSFKHEEKLSSTPEIPDVTVEMTHKANDLNKTHKNWVTKPTSIGNREDDSIDILLENHLRNKRIMRVVFIAAIIAVAATAFSFFLK